MNLENFIRLGEFTPQAFFSWVLVLSMFAKVCSTLMVIYHERIRRIDVVARYLVPFWWATKISALSICAAASQLCRIGGDTFGHVLFSVFFLLVSVIVIILSRSRVHTRSTLAAKCKA